MEFEARPTTACRTVKKNGRWHVPFRGGWLVSFTVVKEIHHMAKAGKFDDAALLVVTDAVARGIDQHQLVRIPRSIWPDQVRDHLQEAIWKFERLNIEEFAEAVIECKATIARLESGTVSDETTGQAIR